MIYSSLQSMRPVWMPLRLILLVVYQIIVAPYASYVRCSPHHHGSLNDTLHIYYY